MKMKIEYDKDFEKVMSELQTNFGWSNINVLLPDNYKDLLNDTIKAVKNCSIPDIDKPTIASELIVEATEMKGKRPTQLNFEELIDVVESVVKKLTIPAVVEQGEQLVCSCGSTKINTTIKDKPFCFLCGEYL